MHITNHRFICDYCKSQDDVKEMREVLAKGWIIVNKIDMNVGIVTSHRVQDEYQPISAEDVHFCKTQCFFDQMKSLFPEAIPSINQSREREVQRPVTAPIKEPEFADPEVESFRPF